MRSMVNPASLRWPRWIARRFARARSLLAERELRAGRYDEAAALFDQAILLARGDAKLECQLWNGLGMVRKYQGRFNQSARAYLLALRAARAARTLDDAGWAVLYHNLGGLEHARGRFVRGEIFSRRSVVLRERALGSDHIDVARDLAAHAANLDGLGRHVEAERSHRRALSIFERHRDAIEVAYVQCNLAASLHALGRSAEAEPMLRAALEIQRERLGREHPDLGLGLYNLAVMERAAGRSDQAQQTAREALRTLEPRLGASHPSCLACRAFLAG